MSLGWRLLLAAGWVIVFGAVCAGYWIFGMLMFTFSLDGASPGDVPRWLEVFMLIGWPIMIATAVVVPALMIAAGVNLARAILACIVLLAASAVAIVACWMIVVL